MKIYTDIQKFFDECCRYAMRDGNHETFENHYYRTSQMEFQLPEWKRFNLSIRAADILNYADFFTAMKRHDAVCWWLIFHVEDSVKYNKYESGYLYYDILDKAKKELKRK